MISKLAVAALLACDPTLTSLFTPVRPRVGRYEVCATTAPLEQVLAETTEAGARFGHAELTEALQAFGTAGTYDRSAVARLYGGTRARVAHGWTEHGDRFEAITLISPYPDGALTHLLPGTLVIRYVVRTQD